MWLGARVGRDGAHGGGGLRGLSDDGRARGRGRARWRGTYRGVVSDLPTCLRLRIRSLSARKLAVEVLYMKA